MLKLRLRDIFRQNLISDLESSSRARFYRFIRPNFGYQEYLNVISAKSHRIALSKLILSSHYLHIETGRWSRPITLPENRVCQFCPGKIEDEFHLFFECTLYENLRSHFIPQYYRNRPSVFKLGELLNKNTGNTLKAISKFVFKCFEIRKTRIEELAVSHQDT